jgi:hypothetical protein
MPMPGGIPPKRDRGMTMPRKITLRLFNRQIAPPLDPRLKEDIGRNGSAHRALVSHRRQDASPGEGAKGNVTVRLPTGAAGDRRRDSAVA